MSKAIKVALYSTAKAIDVATGKFHLSGQELQTEAHKLACSVLVHFGKHHDVRVVLKFINAMPEMGRVNALKDWFTEFTAVTFDGKEAFVVPGKATLVGMAMNTPFWKFSPEPDYKPVDVTKALESLIAKLVKDGAKTGVDHSATITALKMIPAEGKQVTVSTPSPEAEAGKAIVAKARKAAKPVAELSLN